MKSKLNGAQIGPGPEWGAWRSRRDRQITKPRKNQGAVKLAKAERERQAATKEAP